jgi:hypothetical protein
MCTVVMAKKWKVAREKKKLKRISEILIDRQLANEAKGRA